MLARAKPRMRGLQMQGVLGDSMALPFAAHSFDYVVLHLILAVVPDPQKCLAEAVRVLKPGGRILLFDKFLRRGQRAWLRRALSPLVGRLATRMDVVFEDVLEAVPELRVLSDQPALVRGWFRLIELQKEEA
jgi:phosphatidylethanolamine/phosphatidyl-N-methylethanolamine N-methyltransferase